MIDDNIIEQVEEHVIYELIQKIHREPDDFFDGDISDRIEEYNYYNLTKDFDLKKLDKDEFSVDQDIVDEIKELIEENGIDSMPKIVISDKNSIIDGIHRLNALLQLGYEKFDVYIGSNIKLDLKKEINYSFVQEHEVNDFLSNKKIKIRDDEYQEIPAFCRNYIFATEEDNIIGFTCLADSYRNNFRKLTDVITLSNIEVNHKYRNQGIASKMLEQSVEHILKENKILRRTMLEDDGRKYIFGKLSDMCTEKQVPYIHHDHSFIYESLTNKGLLSENNKDFNYSKFQETLKLLCKKLNKDESEISLYDYDSLDSVLNTNKKTRKPK